MPCPTCGRPAGPGTVECAYCGEELLDSPLRPAHPPVTPARAPSTGIARPVSDGAEPGDPDQEQLPAHLAGYLGSDRMPDGYDDDNGRGRPIAAPAALAGAAALAVVLVIAGVTYARTRGHDHQGTVAGSYSPVTAPAEQTPAAYPGDATSLPTDAPYPAATDPASTDLGSVYPAGSDPADTDQNDAYPATPTPTLDPDQSAEAQLESYRQQSLERVELGDQWVAQLSSKYPGVKDSLQTTAGGSHVFRTADILSEYEGFLSDSRFHDVILLWSTDFGQRQTHDGRPLWVTFDAQDFGSAAAVHRWCAKTFAGLSKAERDDSCQPRQLD